MGERTRSHGKHCLCQDCLQFDCEQLRAQLKEAEEQIERLQAGIHGYIADIHARDEVNHDLIEELESTQQESRELRETVRQLREALEQIVQIASRWDSDQAYRRIAEKALQSQVFGDFSGNSE